jgi:hypothetical protein
MKRILIATIAAGLIAGLVPASAAGVHGGGTHGTGMTGTAAPRMHVPRVPSTPVPNLQSRIPTPLPAPAQPPVINGPVGPSGLPPMGNGL